MKKNLTSPSAKADGNLISHISTLIILAFCILPLGAFAQTLFEGGTGSPDDPYQIANVKQLQSLANLVNAGNVNYNAECYILTKDISITTSFILIGSYAGSDENKTFRGVFDGNSKKITGVMVVSDTIPFTGLFGYVSGGTIKNLGVENAFIYNRSTSHGTNAGGIAGSIKNGEISNCYFSGGVNNYTEFFSVSGGIAGISENSNITNCYSTGYVNSIAANASSMFSIAGGVVGNLEGGSIENCYATGLVSSTCGIAVDYAGGIAGVSSGVIKNCAAFNPGIGIAGILNFGRIVALNTGTLESNIAFDKMLNPMATTVWNHKDFNDLDGYNVLPLQINMENSLIDRFPAANGWTTENGKLPGLFGNTVDMPVYLQTATGTETDPFLIYSLVQLQSLSDLVNCENNMITKNKYYKLMSDIDFIDYFGWRPMGDINFLNCFSGIFDGNHKKIINMVIAGSEYQNVGFFGTVLNATIKDLSVTERIYSGRNKKFFAGGVAGNVRYSSISNCDSQLLIWRLLGNYPDEVTAGGIGGLVLGGTITNCFSNIRLYCDVIKESYVGGIAGYIVDTKISNCYSTGELANTSLNDGAAAGGIVGFNYDGSVISNCYSTCIKFGIAEKDAFVGGIAGLNRGILSKCYSTGYLNCASGNGDAYAGGIAGAQDNIGYILDCAALNEGILCEAPLGTTYFGRVLGNNYSGTISNNIAFSRMINPSLDIAWFNKGLLNLDGNDMDAKAINEDGTIGSRFLPGTVWSIQNGSLPGLLGSVVEMPWHLRYNAPSPIIIMQPQSATVGLNSTRKLSVIAQKNENCTLTYQWFSNTTLSNSGGTAIPGAMDTLYQPNTASLGTFYYYVVVTNYMTDNGNGGILHESIASNPVTFIVNEVGVETQSIASLRVYPNPTTGELRIENGELRIENVEVYDVYGRRIEIPRFARNDGGIKFPSNELEGWQPQADGVVFNISAFPAGIYFLRVQTEQGTITKKIIKN